jgi:Ran GTPase-activating protein (RanGAP) involved in mRNA processing and transport
LQLALADVLRENTSLKTLSLQQNCIGPMGVGFMVKALSINSALVMLDLSANLLGPTG